MKRRETLLVLATGLAAASCQRKKRIPGPPPPPPRVLLRQDAVLREAADVSSAIVAQLTKGTGIAVEKVTDKWGQVLTDDGQRGFVPRATFARRTVVVGTDGFTFTYAIADRLRKVPALDVVRVEVTGRVMPGSPAGGVDGAKQLDGGSHAALVVGLIGTGRQFQYELVDLEAKTVVINATTRENIYARKEVDEVVDNIARVLETPLAGATPAATSSATPTPTPHPESRHPNAPLPIATPGAAASPSPSATP